MPSSVRGVQSVHHLDGQVENFVDSKRLGGDALLQCPPLQALHDDEGLAVGLADIVQRADVGMIERRDCAGLALKALQSDAVAGHLLRDKFERHHAPQPRVFGPIDDAHAALAERGQNAVVGDRLSDHLQEDTCRIPF